MRVFIAAILALGLLCLPSLASAQNVVVPNALANVEGNTNNSFPFNITPFSLTSQRYQQVYASNQFSAITVPTLITAISFRTDAAAGNSFNTTLANMQINLSTTAVAPDGLSTTFASNVGGNDTVVYSGALTISSANSGGPPHTFDVVINLQTPFLYNPAGGNLLMDVRNFSGGTTSSFDADFTTGDSISRAFTTSSGVGSGTADGTDSLGLVTQFTFASATVPEPSTLLLGGLGLAGTAWVARRRRAKRKLK